MDTSASVWDRVLAPQGRTIRMWAMIVALVAMSVGDLYMTLLHLKSFGMVEANPLARLIMQYQSPALVVLWKAATVALAVFIFWTSRRHRAAEVGAILCCAVLTALTLQWIRYSEQVSTHTPTMHALAALNAPGFVSMAEP
ncbi:DUF5658 family protein [Leptolyngbya sp. 15MV]|nr:DUF5658 family protein [Leptolyngbya sp. 15MV]